MSNQRDGLFTNPDDRVETVSLDEALDARFAQRHCEVVTPGLWETNRFP